MLISFIFFLVVLCAVFLESVFLPYPLVFIALAVFFLFQRDILFFLFALIFAVLLDILTVASPAITTFLLALFLLFLYMVERVFAVLDVRLYMLFIFIAAEIIRGVNGYPFQFITSIIFFIGLMVTGITLHRLQIKYSRLSGKI